MMKPCRFCARIGRLCVWPYRVLMSLFNLLFSLLFLPDKVRQWVFGTGTRALELLNSLFLLGWATVLLMDVGNVYLIMPGYTKFAEMPHGLVIGLFSGVGLWLLALISMETPRSNFWSGFALVMASLLWTVAWIGFIQSYPPLSVEMVVYAVLAIVSWIAGVHLVDTSKDCRKPGKMRGE